MWSHASPLPDLGGLQVRPGKEAIQSRMPTDSLSYATLALPSLKSVDMLKRLGPEAAAAVC